MPGARDFMLAVQWRWLQRGTIAPVLAYLLLVSVMLALVVAWHATRKTIVLVPNGLMIGGDLYPWARIHSIEIDRGPGLVRITGTDGAGHVRSFRSPRRVP